MDLEFVTTDDLLDELAKRYDHHVFIGTNDVGRDTIETRRQWDGVAHTVCGLCVDIQENVMAALRQSEADRR
jgi:hypothetical protein